MSEVAEGRKRDAFGGRGLVQGHPVEDPVGTVRRSPDGLWLAICLPSPPHPARWTVQDRTGAGGHEVDARVAHWPIVGAVPWSPAAGVPLDGSVATPSVMTKVSASQVRGLPAARPPRERVAYPMGDRL